MKTYRITGWIGLPKELDQLKYRKALIAMSVGGVTRTWLANESGLRRSELDALLKLLITARVLKEDVTANAALPRLRAPVTPSTKPAELPQARTPGRSARAPGPTARLMRAVSRFFTRTVHFERRGGSLEVVLRAASMPVLAAPAAQPRAAERAGLLDGLTETQVERMGATLSALLDRHALSRRIAPHLALFEQVLRRQGATAVKDLPRELLRRAAKQLHELNGERIDGVLASELAPRLAAAIQDDVETEPAHPVDLLRSDFVDAGRLEVMEVGHSMFLEARDQAATKPPRTSSRLPARTAGTAVVDHM